MARDPDRPPRAAPRDGRRLLALGALLATAVALLLLPALHEWLLRAIADAGELIRHRPAAGALAFVLLAALSAMLAFVSSIVLIPVAVHVWGPIACAGLLWIGWFLGGVAAYAVGRYFGRPIVERLVRPAVIARYEGWARSGATLVPILLLQLAVPSDAAGYVFGLVRCRLPVFLVALAVAEVHTHSARSTSASASSRGRWCHCWP
ncbi:MAG: VTT domain-containing protein [Gemmatimonadales bacterium]